MWTVKRIVCQHGDKSEKFIVFHLASTKKLPRSTLQIFFEVAFCVTRECAVQNNCQLIISKILIFLFLLESNKKIQVLTLDLIHRFT